MQYTKWHREQFNKMLFIQSNYFRKHDKEDNMCRKKDKHGHRYMRNIQNIEYFFVIKPDVFWYYT